MVEQRTDKTLRQQLLAEQANPPEQVKGASPAGAKILVTGGSAAGSGQVAQLVEQRTENPCVGGSIPPLATIPC